MSEGDTVGRPNVKPGSLKWYGPDGLTDPEPADLVAAVRAGMESGTIEGEVVETLKNPYNFRVPVSSPGIYIVIGPVSDGGSET